MLVIVFPIHDPGMENYIDIQAHSFKTAGNIDPGDSGSSIICEADGSLFAFGIASVIDQVVKHSFYGFIRTTFSFSAVNLENKPKNSFGGL
ncbi:MAG: hypothetical protein ACRBBP_05685 [Bdellovibrionales bacterium]